jgi:hypothetical protein
VISGAVLPPLENQRNQASKVIDKRAEAVDSKGSTPCPEAPVCYRGHLEVIGIAPHCEGWCPALGARDWRIYASFAQRLIGIARSLYAEEPFGVDLAQAVYALDATTIDLCLSVFPWAPFRSTKAAVKLHTLLDLRGNIPSFIHISDGKMHDVNVLGLLRPEPGAYYVMDRGYLDFERLHRLHEAGSFFVTRAKSNLKAERRYSHPVDRATGLICDQTIVLTGYYSSSSGSSSTCGSRHSSGRLWIAISVYVLVAIVKKRLNLPRSLYENLQILSLTLCEQMPLNALLALLEQLDADQTGSETRNQMILFD